VCPFTRICDVLCLVINSLFLLGSFRCSAGRRN